MTGVSDHWGDDIRANISVENSTNVVIKTLTVDGNYAGDALGTIPDEITGIAYLHSSGTIDGVHVEHTSNSIAGGFFGLQHGSGIFVDNGDVPADQLAITIKNATIDTFQKTGILVWNANVTVTNNDVIGIGATDLIAQNAMQIGSSTGTIGGATAADGNTFTAVGYTGIPASSSSGLIVYEPSAALTISNNTFEGTGDLGALSVGIDLTDVAAGIIVTVTNNAFGTTGKGLYDGIDAYTFDGTLGLNTDPVMSGNTFTEIANNGIFLDPEFVIDGPAFTTTTAFTETGSQFSDVLHGSSGVDTFFGGDGDDDLMGRGGDDTLSGEAGDDTFTYRLGDGIDTVHGGTDGVNGDLLKVSNVGGAQATITLEAVGPGDTDPITVDLSTTGGVEVTADEIEDVTIDLGAGGDTVVVNGALGGTSLDLNTITVNGGAGGDTVDATTLSSAHRIVFNGNGGDDTFKSSNAGGNDSFTGGDTGETNGDTVDYSAIIGGGVNVDLGGGTATDIGGIGVGSDTLTDVDNVIGTAQADIITGSATANTLTGGGSNDALKGDGGDDTLHGGAGTGDSAVFDDASGNYTITYNVTTGNATVTETVLTGTDEGADTLDGVELLDFASGDIDLNAQVLVFSSFDANTGTGTLKSSHGTIQSAVSAADGNDTVYIRNGNYTEQVFVGAGKNGLTILGQSEAGVVIHAPTSGLTFFATDPNASPVNRQLFSVVTVSGSDLVTIKNLTVDGDSQGNQVAGAGDFNGIAYANSSGTVEDVTVREIRDPLVSPTEVSGSQRGNAVLATYTSGAPKQFNLIDSTIIAYQKTGVVMRNATVNLDDNTVTGFGVQPTQGQNGIQLSSGSTGLVTNNHISALGLSSAAAAPAGILLFNAGVVSVTGNDYTGTGVTDVAISLSGTSGATISGNIINTATRGVVEVGTMTVENNVVNSGGTANTYANIATWNHEISSTSNIAFTPDGSTGPDRYVTGGGNDVLTGNGGDDFLQARGGIDQMLGGAGNDTIVWTAGDGNDTLIDGGSHTTGDTLQVLDTAGTDTIQVVTSGSTLAGIGGGTANVQDIETVTLNATAGGIDTLDYTGTATIVSANLATNVLTGFNSVVAGSTIENVTGGSAGDTLIGSSGANVINGASGDDQITGAGGNDTLSGGADSDTFNYTVGDGQDTVDGGSAGVTDIDTLNIAGTAAQETYNINPISGGHLGINIEAGNADVDATDGNYEISTIEVEEIVITTNGGGDNVIVAGDLAGTGVASSTVTVTGDSGNNNFDASGITGTPVRVVFDGAGGTDTLTGGAAGDTLIGGDGSDTLKGGAGNDTIYGGTNLNAVDNSATDTVVFDHGPTGYLVTFGAGGTVTITDSNTGDGDEGTDTLTGVELLNFGGTILDLTKAVRLYDNADHLIGTFDTIAGANTAATADAGSTFTIRVAAGDVNIGAAQVVISKNITLDGAGLDITTLKATADTSTSGDARGLFLVNSGKTFNVSDLTIDGDGHHIWQSIRSYGSGTIDHVHFEDIRFQTSGQPYAGTAIVAFGGTGANVDVSNSTFTNIGRIGIQYFGIGTTGTADHNVYTGKGGIDGLDYAIEVGGGAHAVITNNTVSANTGVATFDNSASAAFLVSTFFNPGTQATFGDNTVTNSSIGVAIGSNATDSSAVTFQAGNHFVTGVGTGVTVNGNATATGTQLVDATFDWDGGAANNSPSGADLADILSGGAGDDTIIGYGGNDTLIGGTGTDTMLGGDGDDTYYANNLDTVTEGSGVGSGIDEVRSNTSYVLGANVENLTLLEGASGLETFENFTPGAITDGENGWKHAGAHDQEVVASGLGSGNAFRMSSDPSNADFGGPYTPGLADTAGEPLTTADFDGQFVRFQFRPVNTTPDKSRLEVDIGTAAGDDRNNFMLIESSALTNGIRIAVASPANLTGDFGPSGTFPNDRTTLATGIDPTVVHEIALQVIYKDGANNDVIRVYLDGKFIGETTTFENYRDFSPETAPHAAHGVSAEANQTNRLFFRAGNNGQPEDGAGGQNAGFLFDNIAYGVGAADGTGNADANVITGNSGNNTLTGMGGNDTLIGGAGVDTFVYAVGDGRDTVDGGTGTDTQVVNGTGAIETFNINAVSASQLGIHVGAGMATLGNAEIVTTAVEEIVINTGNGGDTVNITGSLNGTGVSTSTITVTGGTDGDTVDASALTSAHRIVFNGGDGSDTFISSATSANDTFNGGAGTGDAVSYASVTVNGVTVNLTTGSATGAGTDTLVGVENVTGTAQNDTQTGAAGIANSLSGGSDGTDTVNYAAEAGTGAVTVNLSGTAFGALASGTASDTSGATDALTSIENVSTANATYNDTVVLDGAFSAWTVTFDTDQWTVTKGPETHVFKGVERLVFQNGAGTGDDQTVHLVDQTHAASGYTGVQDAVTRAASGDTILVASGTYNETLTIDKALMILGANHGKAGTAVRGAETVLNWTTGNAVTVNTTAAVTFDGLKFTGTHVTVASTPDTNITFTDSVFELISGGNNSNNFYLNQPTSFTFTDNKLDATGYTGALFQPVGTTGNAAHSAVTFTGNTFTGHAGTYAPGTDNTVPVILNLSDVHGTVTGNTFSGVDIGVLVANGTGPLDIGDNTFEHMHRVGPNTAGGFAAGVVFFTPAPFTGTGIDIHDNHFNDMDAGIRTSGVPGSTVAGSQITIDDNDFTAVTNVGFQPDAVSGVLHVTDTTLLPGPTAVPSEFFGGGSNDTITTTAVADIMHGGAGNDTAVYTGTVTVANITFAADTNPNAAGDQPGWQVNATAGGEGIDLLDDMEIVDGLGAGKILLVGNGGFATIQEAVNASGANDTILISDGTYTEQVTVTGHTHDNLTIMAVDGATVIVKAPAVLTQTATSGSGRAINGVVTVSDATNVQISGIDVDGNGNGNAVVGTNANFIGVAYRNASGGLTNVDVTGVHDAYPGGTTVDGKPIQSGNQRGVGVQVDNATDLAFSMTGGSISDFQKNATVFNHTILNVTGVTITGGSAQTIIAQNGIQASNSTGTISGNTISAIGYAGPAADYSAAILAFGNTNLHITGNGITGANIASLAAKVVGVYVSGGSGGSVTGNGILFTDVGVGIYDNITPNGIAVSDNNIVGLDFTDPSAAGIDFQPTAALVVNYTIDGSNAPDILLGAAGADTLNGFSNPDLIEGRGGADTLNGGGGDDVFIIASSADHPVGETIDGGGNTDTIRFTSTTVGDTLTLRAGVINIFEVEISDNAGLNTGTVALNLDVSAVVGNIRLTGNDGDNVLTGNLYENTINGGDGADTIDGGFGADSINAGAGNDTVIAIADGVADVYQGNGGTDMIDYSSLVAGQNISINLGAGVNSGASIGSDIVISIENATAGGGNDSITGSNANNVLRGGGGDDNIVGSGGNDQVFGDAGTDTLNGGINDFGQTPAAANDVLWGGADTDTFRFDGQFGDNSIGTAGNVDWEDGEDMVFVGYASATPSITDVTDGVLIVVSDGLVASSVFVAGATAADMQVTTSISGLDLIIH